MKERPVHQSGVLSVPLLGASSQCLQEIPVGADESEWSLLWAGPSHEKVTSKLSKLTKLKQLKITLYEICDMCVVM